MVDMVGSGAHDGRYLLKNSSPRLDIKTCFRLLQTLQPDTDIDLDEVECILANLIYRVR